MGNEGNKGLIGKKASEDQWVDLVSVTFFQFSFVVASLFSLSLTLGHLGFYWRTFALDHEGKIRHKEGRNKQGRDGSSSYNRIIWRYKFGWVISLLDLVCMVFHVVI